MDQLICQTEKGKEKVEKGKEKFEKGPPGFRKKKPHTSTSGCIGLKNLNLIESVCEAVIIQSIVESKVAISWQLLYFHRGYSQGKKH